MGVLLSGLSAGGALASAGIKIGVGLAGGILGGLGGAIGAAGGAIIGTFLLPGLGTLGGAVAGSGLFAVPFVGLRVGPDDLGGAVGSALSAIGSAFGELGKGIGDVLASIQSVVSDLIETGNKFAQSTLSISGAGTCHWGRPRACRLWPGYSREVPAASVASSAASGHVSVHGLPTPRLRRHRGDRHRSFRRPL